jgi:GH25 family lysozyme M1 (1,4-beta-N-acetylmuramidase)
LKKTFKFLTVLGLGLLPLISAKARVLGVDVSNYQGLPNFSSVKSGGATFVYVLATESSGANGFIDGDFVTDINNGKAAGLCMGAYDFARPDQDSPSAEAAYFWAEAGPYLKADGKSLMPVLDMETFNGYVGASSYANWANQWCNDIVADAAANGVHIKPVIYTTTEEACSLGSGVSPWNSWIAQPDGGNPQSGNPWEDGGCEEWGSGVWSLWQFSWTGSWPGISGQVDLDVFNGASISPLVATSTTQPPKGVDDFDGDGAPDAVLYRPSNQTWYVRFSSTGATHSFQFGTTNGIIPLLGGVGGSDFDGDGAADAVYVQTSDYTWHIRFSSDASIHTFAFGNGGDVPLLGGDFDGDGCPDAVLYRPSNQTWYVRFSSTAGVHSFQFGTNGIIPLLGGDFDGDGSPDAVYVQTNNYTWHIRFSSDASIHTFAFGNGGDVPLLGGDFDGDGCPDAVLYRPSNQTWYVRFSSTGVTHSFQFGTNGIVPLLGGDFDGDGSPDAMYVQTNNYSWHIRFSSDASTHSFSFGDGGDIPVH